VFLGVPLILSVSLLAKLSPRISWLGSFAMAMLVGVGAATALSGAVIGTLIPQSRAAMDAFDSPSFLQLIEGVVMLAGTILTLIYFQFSAKRAPDGSVKRNVILEILAWGGRVFIAITFGVLFAGVYMAALTAMLERLSSIINFVKSL
jgi:heme/copper-type cytochrome/quinol oxidase subunit 2